jgi:putative transposase
MRAMITELAPTHGGIAHLCRLFGVAESSYHFEPLGRVDNKSDHALRQALLRLGARNPYRGYRYLWREIRKSTKFAHVNRKRVERICRDAGISAKRRARRIFTTDSDHNWRRYPNLVRDWAAVDHPDQVWCADITYVVLGSGEVTYLAVVMDVFTRVARGWALGRDLSHTLPLQALQRALKRGACEIHHSDQGVQYATPNYTQWLLQRNIKISMTDRGAAWQNGYVERFNRTLKEEEVYISDYADFDEAKINIDKFINKVYNRKREHSSLGHLSPSDFEAKWRATRSSKPLP